MQIILYQPQIPQNTGNVVRTCSVTGTSLRLVTPLGFAINDSKLKRAGLDYWEGVDLELIDDFEGYLKEASTKGLHFTFLSSKVDRAYTDVNYHSDSILIFGSETSGLPDWCFSKWPDHFATIPMVAEARCLNLATSVGIVTFEAWRQQNFIFNSN